MKKSTILAAVATAITLASGSSFAEEAATEKCKVTKFSIKAAKADCATSTHSCAGNNKANDAESWIKVPAGQCAMINSGDLSKVDPAVKDKLEMSAK
jgi:uncharacterized membrane protein